MTTVKPNTSRIVAAIMLQTTLIASVGCSALLAKMRGDPSCLPKHHQVEKVATVNVGGQVHEPRQLELGTDGLTLRRALMSAGGARELAMAEARTTSDPDRVAKLQRFAAVGRDAGKLVVHQEVYEALKDQAIGLFNRTPDQLRDAIAVNKKDVEALAVELSKSLDGGSIKALEGYSRAIGINEEKLALFGIPPARTVFGFTQDQFEEARRQSIENEAKVMSELTSSLGVGVGYRSVRTEFLVALERRSAVPPLTYYFPYELAIAGLASEIQLRGGDSVDVVDIRDTELNPQTAGSASGFKNIAIDGYVNSPGVKSVATIGAVPIEGVPNISDTRSVWMLVRPSSAGIGQTVFVLPDRLVAPNGAAADAPAADGDVYNYLILPQIPIVTESLLVQTVELSKRHCVDKLAAIKQKKQQHKEKVHQHFERFRGH